MIDDWGPDIPDQDAPPMKKTPIRIQPRSEVRLENCERVIAAFLADPDRQRMGRLYIVCAFEDDAGTPTYRHFTANMIPEVAAYVSVQAADLCLRIARGDKLDPIPEPSHTKS